MLFEMALVRFMFVPILANIHFESEYSTNERKIYVEAIVFFYIYNFIVSINSSSRRVRNSIAE